MFQSSDDERDDDDADMLELNKLIEDVMAEEEKIEKEFFERNELEKCQMLMASNPSAKTRAAIVKRLNDLEVEQKKHLERVARETYAKKKDDLEKRGSVYLNQLYGQIDLSRTLPKWDRLFFGDTSRSSTSSTKHRHPKDKLDNIYPQFMYKSEDEGTKPEAIIRSVATARTNLYLRRGSINEETAALIIKETIQFHLQFNGN